MRRIFFALVSLSLLTACDTETAPLEVLQSAQPAADPYQEALAQGYKQISESEDAQGQDNISAYFAEKGLDALQGKPVAPEALPKWHIADTETQNELVSGQSALQNAITANRSTQPAQTADAQLAYDRWVIASATETDPARVEDQRAAFYDTLSGLQNVHAAQAGVDAPSSEPMAATADHSGHGATILYFPFDRDSLGASANAAIQRLAGDINAAPQANVSINGHTDRAGTEQYNLALSERRAKFVLHALEAAGIPEKRMHYFAFGESDPAVPTADGVREPKNRRVEIFIE